MTILISSHVLSDLAELCTSVGIMELGYLVESCNLNQLYQRQSRQQIFISTLGDLEPLKAKIDNCALVEEWETVPQKNGVRVYFTGDRTSQCFVCSSEYVTQTLLSYYNYFLSHSVKLCT